MSPDCVPVPLKEMASGCPDRLLATETLPEALPTAVGANLTLILAVSDASKVNGAVTPLRLKLLPATVMLFT